MMKKIKFKTILISILSVFAFTAFVPSIISLANTANPYALVLNGEFEDFYQVGDQLVLPSGVVTNGTKSYNATVNLLLPNNTATKNTELKLTETGTYTIEYSAYLQDLQKYFVKSYDIIVNNSLFSVVGEGSIEYLNYSDSIKGAVATMYNGDSFTYNNYVDLKEMKASALFKMIAYPQIIGEADANKLIIKITDVHDENKYLTIRVKKSEQKSEGVEWGWYASYVDANFTDGSYSSPFVGMTYNEKGKFECNGQKYSVTKNSESFGTETQISLTGGVKGNSTINNKSYSLAYDYAKNQLHSYVMSPASSNKQLISNFADINIFPQLFEGFTDGKVKISITPEGFNKSYCKLIFTEFAGKPVVEDGYNTFNYKQAPDITIDFAEYSEDTVPNGKPNVAYNVYNATAFDFVDGAIPVNTKVYYGYTNENKVSIDIVDGKFTPKFAGVYTIEYTAKNSFGNSTVKTVDVLVENKVSDLSFEVQDFVSSTTAGSEFALLSGFTAENYYGNTYLKVIAELSTDSTVKYELTAENNYTFRPTYAGTYNVKFICTDNVESVELNKNLTVTADEYIMYSIDGCFPHYLIKNGTYNLPRVVGVELSTGKPVTVQTELYLIKPDNSSVKSNGVVLVDNDEYLKLSYKPVGLSWAEPYEVVLPIINTGLGTSKISKDSYFVATSGEFTNGATADDTYYVVDEFDSGVASIEFANILQGHSFSISLAPYISSSGFKSVESITLLLKDVLDVNKVVKFTAYTSYNGVYFTVNGGKETKIADSWGTAGDSISINYDVTNSLAKINSSYDMEIKNFFGLEDAVVFENGLFAEIIIKSPNVGCGVRVSSINDQILSSSSRDRNAPVIDATMNNNKGEYNINDVITFYPYKAYDVLSPTVKFSFSIKLPNGAYATATDGTILNGNQDVTKTYQLKLDNYGDYEVYPVAVDVINEVSNTNTSYKMNVVDKRLPVITLGEYVKTAKVNTAFAIATYTIDKADCITFVTVQNSDGIYELVTGNEYTPRKKGKYVITISAMDATYNIAHCEYTVTVK